MGDVVDLDATLGEQLLDVAEGQAKRRYQRTASTIISGGKQKPAKVEGAGSTGGSGEWFSWPECQRSDHLTANVTEPSLMWAGAGM
jgi:hypothetical protein